MEKTLSVLRTDGSSWTIAAIPLCCQLFAFSLFFTLWLHRQSVLMFPAHKHMQYHQLQFIFMIKVYNRGDMVQLFAAFFILLIIGKWGYFWLCVFVGGYVCWRGGGHVRYMSTKQLSKSRVTQSKLSLCSVLGAYTCVTLMVTGSINDINQFSSMAWRALKQSEIVFVFLKQS